MTVGFHEKLKGFHLKISDRHLYYLHIGRTPKTQAAAVKRYLNNIFDFKQVVHIYFTFRKTTNQDLEPMLYGSRTKSSRTKPPGQNPPDKIPLDKIPPRTKSPWTKPPRQNPPIIFYIQCPLVTQILNIF